MFAILIFLTAVLITACGAVDAPVGITDEPTGVPTIRIASQQNAPSSGTSVFSELDSQVEYSTDEMRLVIDKPEGWDAINTTDGIVISEGFASVETAGVLEGLMAHTFFNTTSNLPIDVSELEHPSHAVLVAMAADAATHRLANRTQVASFEWDGYDAAYYVLSDSEDVSAFVVSVMLPEEGGMLTSIVSAPYSQRDRIGETLPALMDNLQLNDVTLRSQSIEPIAASLEFLPPPDSTAVATAEETAEATAP
jgi:hypothetical protein